MSGKIVLVTGGTAGIGKQTALQLLQQGAHVVIVGRNPEKTKGVVDELKQRSGNTQVDFLLADLSKMADVKRLAAEYIERFGVLNVLVNNAGAMNTARDVTADGLERTFATNHLAYYLLARELIPALEKGAPSRIVNVSSDAHRAAPIDFDDLQHEKGYSTFKVYGRSKLMNILFTRELSKRLKGKKITVNSLHPGFVASEFLSKGGIWTYLKPVAYLFAINEEQGARTSVYLASSPECEGKTGLYWHKSKEARTTKHAVSDESALKLWEMSEQILARLGIQPRAV